MSRKYSEVINSLRAVADMVTSAEIFHQAHGLWYYRLYV